MANERSSGRSLWPLWLSFLLLGWGVGRIVLPDFGPDEPYHVAYVDSLARYRRLPDRAQNHIVQHPPLFYALLAPFWKLAAVDQEPLSIESGPQASRLMSPSALRGRAVLRALQPLFALASLLLMARALSLLRVRLGWQVVLLGLVAAWPMWGYVAGVVSNENFSILFCSLAACLTLRLLAPMQQAGESSAADAGSSTSTWSAPPIPTLRQAAIFGAILGAGTMVKQTTLFCLPVGLAALWLASQSVRVRNVAVAVGAAVATGIWWPLHNLIAHGELFPSFTTYHSAVSRSQKVAAIPSYARLLAETAFLPDWSWLFFPGVLSTVAAVLMVVVIVAALISSLARRSPGKSSDAREVFERRARGLCLAALLLLSVGILQYALLKDEKAQVGGRYLLNGAPFLVALLGACLPPRERAEKRNSALWLGACAGLGLLILIDIGWWLVAWTYYGSVLNGPG